MSNPPRLLRPRVRCPECHQTPRLRIPERIRDLHAKDAPLEIVASLQCHRCHTVYAITAAAFQQAA